MREGTTSRMMAAERPYGEFCEFYSVSPKYFGYTLVYDIILQLSSMDFTSDLIEGGEAASLNDPKTVLKSE
jgi:hypothetical protein